MNKIFYKKSTSIVFVAAMLVLVLLLCMLLVTLTQLTSLRQRADKLNAMIEEAIDNVQKTKELIEYLQTDDYVRKWAEDHNRIDGDNITWLNDHVPQDASK